MTPQQTYYWKNRERIIERQREKREKQKEDKSEVAIDKVIDGLSFKESINIIENHFDKPIIDVLPNLSKKTIEILYVKAACDCRAGSLENILKESLKYGKEE